MIDQISKKVMTKQWSRRKFLKQASQATLATLAAGCPTISWGRDNLEGDLKKLLPATADQVVLLWMAGGQSHTDTYDPKKYTPYKAGNRQYRIVSTFPSIPTVVDGVRFSEGLENTAKVIDRGTVIRSFSPPDLGHILHSRHQFHWHTGYVPPQTIEVPHIGSMITKVLGPKNPKVPPFVHIGQRLDIDGSPEVQAFLTAGFLGGEYSPLLIPYPEQAMDRMSPPVGMELDRFQDRQKLYKKLLANTPIGEFGSDYQKESLLRAIDNGFNIIDSPYAEAFNLKKEPDDIYNTYNTGRFGLGCLLARRLVEAGVRFVEVSTEHIPFGNWDTHDDGYRRTKEMKRLTDAPIAQLVLDLEERGLLDRTLIVVASEFSRAAMKEDAEPDPGNKSYIMHQIKHYGLHRHYTGAGSAVMFGGGVKKGFVYGETADEAPCKTIKDPVSVMDLHATIFRTLGIPADMSFEIERRPFYVTEDGHGKPVKAVLS